MCRHLKPPSRLQAVIQDQTTPKPDGRRPDNAELLLPSTAAAAAAAGLCLALDSKQATAAG